MVNDAGTSPAPTKAAGKSDNVSGSQVEQMLLKREAEAAKEPKSADTIVQAEAKADAKEIATITAPDAETPDTSKPAKEDAKAKESEKTTEPEADSDEVLSHKLSPEIQANIDKRIGKEVAKTKALQEEITRLKAMINVAPQPSQTQTQAPIIVPTSDNPLADITDPAALAKQQQDAKEAKRWAQEMLDRDDIDKGVAVGDKTYTKAQLKQAVRNAERMIEDLIPARAQYLQQRQQADKATVETFGALEWFQDRTSEGYQAYQQILRDPIIAGRPNASYLAAIQTQGLLDIQRRKQAAGEPAKLPAKLKASPSQLGGAGSGPATSRVGSDTRAVAELQKEMERLKGKKGITGRDAQAYLQRMEQARATR